jgi:hypothetical protein
MSLNIESVSLFNIHEEASHEHVWVFSTCEHFRERYWEIDTLENNNKYAGIILILYRRMGRLDRLMSLGVITGIAEETGYLYVI